MNGEYTKIWHLKSDTKISTYFRDTILKNFLDLL